MRRFQCAFVVAVCALLAPALCGANGVQIFTACIKDEDCTLMNGVCFDSVGNDLARLCSCALGHTFVRARAICAPPAANTTVAVNRTLSPIYYAEQRGGTALTRSRARFPGAWTCDTLNEFCWSNVEGVHYTSFEIGQIMTDDRRETELVFSYVVWRCSAAGSVFYRRSDSMSSDPDLANGMRPAPENCVSMQTLCSSSGNGNAASDGRSCACAVGWSGATCSSRAALDIARAVRPVRTCPFPLATGCAPNELCYLYEDGVTTDANAALGGHCWCGPGWVPGSTVGSSQGADVCVRTVPRTIHGVPALPYGRAAPSYTLQVDQATRQYMHYSGQGYEYASIAPYPLRVEDTLMRINDTMSGVVGAYLWRCNETKTVWNATARDCVLTSPPQRAATDGTPPFRIAYASCANPNTYGPECILSAAACRTARCSGNGNCTRTHQGCACDVGFGSFDCSQTACHPNLFEPAAPHVYNATIGACNCSAAFGGQWCEEFTCGNRWATLASDSVCECAGVWGKDRDGKCTVNRCPVGQLPHSARPELCVSDPSHNWNEGNEVPYDPPVAPTVSDEPLGPPTPGDDDRYVQPPYKMSPVAASIVTIYGTSAAVLVASVFAGALL